MKADPSAGWAWIDYYDTLVGPDGVVYDMVGFAERSDLKSLLNGRSFLIEHDEDERRLWASTRLPEYTATRAIPRSSDRVVDLINGMTGTLWAVRSRQDRSDRRVMLSCGCEP